MLWCLYNVAVNLLVEETEVPVTDKLYYKMLSRVHLAWVGFELTMLVVIGTDCIGSCKSNNHSITALNWILGQLYHPYHFFLISKTLYFTKKIKNDEFCFNSEWVNDCCLTPAQQLLSYILWRKQVNFQWDDDGFRFVLDQHT
jgi:hypothetical protein